MKSLLTLLRQLGFDDIQAQVYSEVHEMGPITVLELSRNTGIKRPTVHFHVEQLLERGLLNEGIRRGRRVVTAVDPEVFSKIIDEQKQQVKMLENSLNKMVSEMKESGSDSMSYGMGFCLEDGVGAVERVYSDAMTAGEVFAYIDVSRIDGLTDIRAKLFGDVALRQSVYSYKELYYSRDPGAPEYLKKLRVYKPFTFTKSSVKLQGKIVNILCFEKTVAIITKDVEWKVMRITQPMVAQFIAALVESMFTK